jgi:hypothetical protein
LLDVALCQDELIATAHLVSGEFVELIGIYWATAWFRRDIIFGGAVRALPGDGIIARYEDAEVLLDEAAFEAWRPKRAEEKPATSEAAWGTPREAGRKVLALLAKLDAAGRQFDNLNEDDEGKLRRKLVADTSVSYQTAVRLLAEFRKGRRVG